MSTKAVPPSTAPVMSMFAKSPFSFALVNDVFTTIVPQGHEKALKLAFYNTIALVFLVCVVCILIAVHFILEPFLRPLLWSLLFGCALHPFKRKLVQISGKWLSKLKRNRTPFVIGAAFLPLTILDWALESIKAIIMQYQKLVKFIAVFFVFSYLFIFYFPITHLAYVYLLWIITHLMNLLALIPRINNPFLMLSITLGHFIAVIFWWSASTRPFLVLVSPLIWIGIVSHVITMTGTFGFSLAVLLGLITVIGLCTKFVRMQTNGRSEDHVDSITMLSKSIWSWTKMISQYFKFLLPSHHEYSVQSTPISDISTEEIHENITTADAATSPFNVSLTETPQRYKPRDETDSYKVQSKQIKLSNIYLYVLIWIFLLCQFYFHPKLLLLLPIPITLLFMKWLWVQFCNNIIAEKIEFINLVLNERRDALFHPLVLSCYRYFQIGDQVVSTVCKQSTLFLTPFFFI